MQQKTSWKLLLIIGMVSNMLHSCSKGEIDRVYLHKFIFVNINNQEIVIAQYKSGEKHNNNNNNISAGDSIIQTVDLFAGDISDIIPFSDSIEIVFNEQKALKFFPNSIVQHNILNLEEYDSLNLTDELKEYHYLVTDEDYDNAITIEQ